MAGRRKADYGMFVMGAMVAVLFDLFVPWLTPWLPVLLLTPGVIADLYLLVTDD